jgi:hypothetical protein
MPDKIGELANLASFSLQIAFFFLQFILKIMFYFKKLAEF